MDYNSMKVLELKTLCRERGLRVSGNKNEVIIRLMEHDEQSMPQASYPVPQASTAQASYPVPKAVQIPQTPLNPQPVQGGYAQPQYILPAKNSDGMASTIGTFVIMYAFFRLFWAAIFSLGIGGNTSWLLSPVAFLIGIGFIVGGGILYAGYRNGAYITLGILAISGLLSVIFHGDEPNPVSVAWGDQMIMTSLMCSVTCMILVALPLFLSQLKEGWPEQIEKMLENKSENSTTDSKVKIQCTSCNKSLKIPKGYSGKIQCPSCNAEMRI